MDNEHVMNDIESRLVRHNAFWEKKPVERPLIGFRIGDYLFANTFQAARPLLQEGKKILPEMVSVDRFIDDYERMHHESLETGQDAFWTASPFTAIPWMEAILGCEIRASEASFTSEPWLHDLNEIDQANVDEENNPWLAKYLEFVEKLTNQSQGRYPVGQPIMRGTSDMMGALRGQTNLVFDFVDNPEKIRQIGQKVTEIFRKVIQKHQACTKTFQGGYAMGFYHLWCPGPCIWFQEDLAALISPALYRKYIYELDSKICQGYEYTLCHIHPTSFFILDDLLQIDGLKAIEINKDIGGPSIKDMLPVFKKVLHKKRLVIWGDLDEADLDVILQELPYEGLYLHIVAATVEEAKHLMQYIQENEKKS
jgi:hypothetical protein